jgi:peptidoglycan/xylan/chitin deacetylase (PgdA/CDA1 family)
MYRLILLALSCVLMACSTTSSDEAVPVEPIPGVVFHVETDRKMVAMTVDDGPDTKTTGRILDVLREHGAHATFFVIGKRVEGNESLLARMRDEGHELANHTSTDRPSILFSSSSLSADLKRTHELLAPYGDVRWFRPGWGAYHGAMVRAAAELGYRTALGDVFPYDVFIPSTAFQKKYVLDHVKWGSIIILHDGGGRGKRTATTLEGVLPQLQAQGYEVVTLSQLAEAGGE